MTPAQALALWAKTCDRAGVKWYLFRDTLLCAEGYHHLPENLSCAQVAVLAADMPLLAQQVFCNLPEGWVLDIMQFGRGKRMLTCLAEQVPVLQISVLYGVEDAQQIEDLDRQVGEIMGKVNTKMIWNKVFRLFFRGLYTNTLGIPVQNSIQKQMDRVFSSLVALCGSSRQDAACFCDRLTNKNPALIPAFCPEKTEYVCCDGVSYPVFPGFRDYLTQVYGQYELGLHDEIGCGLTEEDKVALKAHQARCFEALTFLQELSREFGLRYYLLAGSVLGAVRHQGFIPWDDDIDVGIRIEDLEKMEQVVKEQLPKRLPEGFTLMMSGPNNPFPRMFSKICYEGRCCIDLWPLVPTYNDGLRAKILFYFGKLITKVHYQKIGHKVTKYRKVAMLTGMFLSDKQTMALARHNERKYARRKTPAYINLYSIYTRPKETIQRRWLDDEATAIFNGLEVPVVGCTQEYLTHMYGDYMAFPAPWKRASRHFERFFPQDTN